MHKIFSEGKVIEHWLEYCACLEFDLPSRDTNKLQSEDRLREDYESEVRKIKAVYKDKRQILNHDMHLRLSLADTDEETTFLSNRWMVSHAACNESLPSS